MRRLLLAVVIVALAVSSADPQSRVRIRTRAGRAASGGGANAARGGKALLTHANLTLLGAFNMPIGGVTRDSYTFGLTGRYVSGSLRFMAFAVDSTAFEIGYNGVSLTPSYPTATSIKNCGDMVPARFTTGYTTPPAGFMYGAFWDAATGRFYASISDPYNATYATDYSFIYTTLSTDSDCATGGSNNVGPFQITDVSVKAVNIGMLRIPSWFATLYTAGKDIGAGLGGYQSILNVGPASLGPSLYALSVAGTGTAGISLSGGKILLNYPPAPTLHPMQTTNTGYTDQFNAGANDPSGGHGFWSWTDNLQQGCGWVDTATKSGYVCFWEQGLGAGSSTINATSTNTTLNVADATSFTVGELVTADVNTVESKTIAAAGVSGTTITLTNYSNGVPRSGEAVTCSSGGSSTLTGTYTLQAYVMTVASAAGCVAGDTFTYHATTGASGVVTAKTGTSLTIGAGMEPPGPAVSAAEVRSDLHYFHSNLYAGRFQHKGLIIDPVDMGKVANATLNSYDPVATEEWVDASCPLDDFYTGTTLTEPHVGNQGIGHYVPSVWFDSTTDRIYVSYQHGNGGFTGNSSNRVCVYQVN